MMLLHVLTSKMALVGLAAIACMSRYFDAFSLGSILSIIVDVRPLERFAARRKDDFQVLESIWSEACHPCLVDLRHDIFHSDAQHNRWDQVFGNHVQKLTTKGKR